MVTYYAIEYPPRPQSHFILILGPSICGLSIPSPRGRRRKGALEANVELSRHSQLSHAVAQWIHRK